MFCNLNLIDEAIKVLHDQESKEILKKVFEFRYKNDTSILKEIYTDNEYYPEGIIETNEDEIFIDGGAYDGDTAIEYALKSNFKYKKIYSFEPDEYNFLRMKEKIKNYNLKNIEMISKGLSNQCTTAKFASGYGVGSRIIADGDRIIETLAIDQLDLKGDIFIKLDIEGEELNALEGAKNTIIKNKPKLAICIYHKLNDMYSIPLYIKSIVPEYKLYIRHHNINKCWSTVCYAVV